MKRKTTKGIALFLLVSCLAWSGAFAAKSNQQTELQIPSATEKIQNDLKPVRTMRATEPLIITCAKLSNAIKKDKEQLISVLGYLHSNDCDNEPAASSTTCVQLNSKKEALEARIQGNQRKARDLNCT